MIESNTSNNDIDNQQDQQQEQISQEELSKQRIQKRKEDAKRIMDERKKRELQPQRQQQQQYDQQDDEIDEMPQKHKRFINEQQQQDGDIDDQQQTSSYDQAPQQKIGQRKVPLPPMVQQQQQSIKSPSSTSVSSNSNLREDMVKKAVLFLNNPNVKNTALGRKVAYLEKKGLTTDEVKEALKRIETGNINGTSTSTAVGNSVTRTTPLPPQQQYNNNNNNNYNNQLQAQQQVQYYQQQQQMAATQITSYQKRLEADDARIAQLMYKNNGISWNSILYSVTAIVGAASGLAYLTSNYIVPYINGNKNKLASENVDKKISELQEEIIKLQSTIITQGNEFKDTTKSLKSLIEQQQQQLSQQQQLTTTTASTISATSSSNTTEIFEIKKELRNLTSLINNNNNNNSNSNNNSSNNSNNNNSGTSKYNGFNGIYNKSEPDTPSTTNIKPNTAPGSNLPNTNRSIPPIVKSNPYSHLSWKPPTDQPPVIPSWQQKDDSNPPQPTNSTTSTTTTTTPTIPTINSNPPTPTKPIYQSSYNYGDVNSLGGSLKFDGETTNKSPIDLTSTSNTTGTDSESKNTTTTTTTTSTSTSTTTADPTKPADETPYSSDFLDVINQLKQGKTPPGIRTDIDDKPMENATITKSSKERPKKPWEKDSLTSIAGNLSAEETKTIVGGSSSNVINSNHTLPSYIDYSDDEDDAAQQPQSQPPPTTQQQPKDENDNNEQQN